jgi:acetate kinase
MLVLVVNAGSSSVKYQLIDMQNEQVLAKGVAERIGIAGGKDAVLTHQTTGKEKVVISAPLPDHRVAMRFVFDALTNAETGAIASVSDISAIGHRVLHGGAVFTGSVLINKTVTDTIRKVSHLGPLHNPANLMGIEAAITLMPDAPQVAVFDTAFHQTMPQFAHVYALPYEFYTEHDIRRYGFHGTSHKYVSSRTIKFLNSRGLPSGKFITCHLGNGVSFTAVVDGKSFDTSMGLTPAEGLVMGTRSGDIDPAIIPYIQNELGYTAEQCDDLINKKSGLLGLSGLSHDMRDIEENAEAGHDRSKLALDIFCYRARKYIGAYAAAMDGLDAIVFTGGIGEHSPKVRSMICDGLGVLGIGISPGKNESNHGECDISSDDARVRVLVIPTNEELEIARETVSIVSGQNGEA